MKISKNMNKELLKLICCPSSKKQLRILNKESLANLNQAISAGLIKNNQGKILNYKIDQALITEDYEVAYIVRADIPILLENESINMKLIDGPFKYLDGVWEFESFDDKTIIYLSINYEAENEVE